MASVHGLCLPRCSAVLWQVPCQPPQDTEYQGFCQHQQEALGAGTVPRVGWAGHCRLAAHRPCPDQHLPWGQCRSGSKAVATFLRRDKSRAHLPGWKAEATAAGERWQVQDTAPTILLLASCEDRASQSLGPGPTRPTEPAHSSGCQLTGFTQLTSSAIRQSLPF